MNSGFGGFGIIILIGLVLILIYVLRLLNKRNQNSISHNEMNINNKIDIYDHDSFITNQPILTSADFVPGKEITEIIGVVSGSNQYNPVGIVGEGLTGKTGDVYRKSALDKATNIMLRDAFNQKADAVIKYNTETTLVGPNILITVTGTAVRCRDVVSANTENHNATSDADEIIKFKQLLDQGIITQEEFDIKKKQILGL